MSLMSKRAQLMGLALCLLITFAAAAVGSVASVGASAFYAELVRPEWAPPGWLFGPVWTTLYLLMALAAWLVWRECGLVAAKVPLTLYGVQLVVNALWSWLFFGWHLGGIAFADVLLLIVLVFCTMITFSRIKPVAGVLLIPYLLWVMFAALLNYSVWQLNPHLLG